MRITSNHLVHLLSMVNQGLGRPVDHHDQFGKANVGHLTLSRCNGTYCISEITSTSGGELKLMSNLTAKEADVALTAMTWANIL